MRLIILMGLLVVLAGCSSFGPPEITITRSDIEKRAFIDPKSGELGKLFKELDRSILTGPDVGFMTNSQRIEFAWTVTLPDDPMVIPLSLRIAISGIPKLNAAKQGIDLADTRVEEFRMPSIPFLNMTDTNMSQGSSLGSIPLLQFDPSELRHDDVVYEPTGISLGLFGLHVKLAPK